MLLNPVYSCNRCNEMKTPLYPCDFIECSMSIGGDYCAHCYDPHMLEEHGSIQIV